MCAIDHFFMPASIYQHASVLQIAPAVGTGFHMAQGFTGDLTILLMKCCCSSGGTCWRRNITPVLWITSLLLGSHWTPKVSSAAQTRPLAQAGVLPLHRNPPLPSWTSGCLPHPPDNSAERECLLWCKSASARRNHNTFLLGLLYVVVNALWLR